MSKKLLILNGSPRKNKTSYSFGRTLKMLMEEKGHNAEIEHLIAYLDGEKELDVLANSIQESDMICLIAPLYVDTLPYPVIWAFEKLAKEYMQELNGKVFFAIGQCGFPDITRCEPLLGTCRLFAQETGMKWLGGLGYGGGAILDGALLEDLGKQGKKLTLAFQLALENIIRGEKIGQKSQDLITIKIPRILLRPLAVLLNHKSRQLGRKNGITDLSEKVYLEE